MLPASAPAWKTLGASVAAAATRTTVNMNSPAPLEQAIRRGLCRRGGSLYVQRVERRWESAWFVGSSGLSSVLSASPCWVAPGFYLVTAPNPMPEQLANLGAPDAKNGEMVFWPAAVSAVMPRRVPKAMPG